jgi:hypothetical protein
VSLNDLLHLLLNLLGEDTTAELLQERLVLRLELLDAGLSVLFYYVLLVKTYKDFSQAVIWLVSTLSRRPLTPA